MSRPDRLVQAVRTGALALPERGDILVLRAASPALAEAVDPARLAFEAAFRPGYDLLAAAGLRVTARAVEPAAMAVVTLGRARAENLGDVARALALLPPGATLALDGAQTDGIDSLARQIGAVLPLAGDFAKAHGRVVWLTRPAALPPEVAAWAAAAAPARNAAGFVTAPGMFSPEGPDPGSLRLAAAFDARLEGPRRRPRGRLGLARARGAGALPADRRDRPLRGRRQRARRRARERRRPARRLPLGRRAHAPPRRPGATTR